MSDIGQEVGAAPLTANGNSWKTAGLPLVPERSAMIRNAPTFAGDVVPPIDAADASDGTAAGNSEASGSGEEAHAFYTGLEPRSLTFSWGFQFHRHVWSHVR